MKFFQPLIFSPSGLKVTLIRSSLRLDDLDHGGDDDKEDDGDDDEKNDKED